MGNVQDQSAVQDAMTIEDAAQDAAEEVSVDALYEALTAEPEPESEPETQAEEEPEPEPELTPEEQQKQALMQDIKTLQGYGLTSDDLNAIARDNQVRADVQGGKGFGQAVMAYLRRQISPAAPKAAKRGVPTARSTSTAGTREQSAIETMSDEEFAKFSDEATRLAREGKRVTIR